MNICVRHLLRDMEIKSIGRCGYFFSIRSIDRLNPAEWERKEYAAEMYLSRYETFGRTDFRGR